MDNGEGKCVIERGMYREWHGFEKPTGKYTGLAGVGVRVGYPDPTQNPYPICYMAGD